MEEKSLIELKEKARKIIGNNRIEVLTDEENLIRKLNDIIDDDNTNIDYELTYKILNNIEIYLETKEKMLFAKADYKFLSEFSKELKKQSIRRTDGVLYVPLFKIVDKDGTEKYFLTRRSAKEYIEYNNNWVMSDIIEIDETDNTDLAKLVEIIKRNF